MNRSDFLRTGALAGAGLVLPNSDAFSNNIVSNDIDKLVDVNGNYFHQPLPYSEGFLEPYMDSETLHLHYTFHHGGAVKAV